METFDQYCAEENTHGGGNVLGEGVFIDNVGLARARSWRSPGYDGQWSMAKHEATTRTALHMGIEG